MNHHPATIIVNTLLITTECLRVSHHLVVDVVSQLGWRTRPGTGAVDLQTVSYSVSKSEWLMYLPSFLFEGKCLSVKDHSIALSNFILTPFIWSEQIFF